MHEELRNTEYRTVFVQEKFPCTVYQFLPLVQHENCMSVTYTVPILTRALFVKTRIFFTGLMSSSTTKVYILVTCAMQHFYKMGLGTQLLKFWSHPKI